MQSEGKDTGNPEPSQTHLRTISRRSLPTAWEAIEDLLSPNPERRRIGLDRLLEVKGAAQSPVVFYLLTTRLVEPDLSLRGRLIQAIARLIRDPKTLSNELRSSMCDMLSEMHTRQILALLQAGCADPALREDITSVLECCKDGGRYLSDVLWDRNHPGEIREQAAFFIGEVGYTEAIPMLERIIHRWEARQETQKILQNSVVEAEDSVIESVRRALDQLQAP